MNVEKRMCQNCKREFTITPDDFAFYSKIKVPPPTFCPDCRLQRRMTFRNERSLYKRTCDLCKKPFVSMYSPDKSFTVYCKECWYSDNWDPLQYGQEYDWNKPFFTQFRELMHKVPRIGIMHIHTNVNADYANYVADSKNVYLSQSVIAKSENVYYSRNIDTGKDIFDCFYLKESERCYEALDCSRIYQSRYLVRSRDCINSAFLFDCVNCQNCFMSMNLRNKQYVIRNAQYSKGEYEKAMEKVNLGGYSNRELLQTEFVVLMQRALHKFGNLVKTTDCTGDNVENSKNVKTSFAVYDSENSKFLTRVLGAADCYDITGAGHPELVYEAVAVGYESYNSRFLNHGDATGESLYCDWCQSCENLFGCISIRKKKYCILNKQYSEMEYKDLVPKIIAHMNEVPYIDGKGRVYKFGEFFPIELSPFGHNETFAQEYFPLTREKTIAQGYPWHEPEPLPYAPTIKAADIPDDVRDALDSLMSEIIACGDCGRAYRIVKPEFEFLKRERIALPRKCERCRYRDRFDLRNPLKLWHRRCCCNGASRGMDHASREAESHTSHGPWSVYQNMVAHFHGETPCLNEFETSYAPERVEVVYCEQCYNAEIV